MAESLSERTKSEFRQAFDIFDINKDGLINFQDLTTLLNMLHFTPSLEELKSITEEFTMGKKEEINFSEFLEIVSVKMFDDNAEQDLLQAFKIFDVDGRGTIDNTLLKNSILEVDKDITVSELEALLRDVKDENGFINYTKLVREFLIN